ncbi:MAG: MaoC family dehydratase [Chloroflexota bacterium]|nr:MAG: MaoC family dehydratase [Chloroflexota bacterium]
MTEYRSRDDFTIGERAQLSRSITDDDIRVMADITGDFNPVHMDDEFAGRTRFKGRIAHGMFSAGLISAVLGTKLPGPGSVYLKQELNFLYPVRAGDTLTAEVEVTNWRADKRIITLKTRCHNQDGRDVVDGEAVILVEKL